MKVLLIGGGAREHAMAKAVARSEDATLFALLKNKNPGIERIAKKCHWADVTDVAAVVEFAKQVTPDVVAVGPEGPLETGVADALTKAGFPVAAPTKAAAAIETDKSFMRLLLDKHRIAGNVAHHVFDTAAKANSFLDKNGAKFALKPVGLTGGKGVQVYGDHFHDLAGAMRYVSHVFADKVGGGRLIVEELLDGEEFTLQAFTDGSRIVPMVAVQDHKRLLPGDEGPNTGGMGSYSQADGLLPFLPRADFEESAEILKEIVAALAKEDRPYHGPIYGQFMLTHTGPRVVEVNARFGDPEAMNVLHLFDGDFVEVLARMADGSLSKAGIAFRDAATVVKYVVPEGYGTKPMAGQPIRVDEAKIAQAGADVYYAAVDQGEKGSVLTTSSRALALLGHGETLLEANEMAEEGLKHVTGPHIFVRHDVGTRELIERRLAHMKIVREA